MLTCLWERSPNRAPEPLPLDLLCHCLFLPWKTLKKPMLESLLQKAIRWQLISALKMSENILEITVYALNEEKIPHVASMPTPEVTSAKNF